MDVIEHWWWKVTFADMPLLPSSPSTDAHPLRATTPIYIIFAAAADNPIVTVSLQ